MTGITSDQPTKEALTSEFYYSIGYCLTKPHDTTEAHLIRFVKALSPLLRAVEANIQRLIQDMGYLPDYDLSIQEAYGHLRERWNALARDYERFLKETGSPDFAFKPAPALSDIPKRAVTEQGERVYPPGSNFDVYKDVRRLVEAGKKEVFLIEPYPNEELFELYLDRLAAGVRCRVLVANPKGPFAVVAKKFTAKAGVILEIRKSADVHDRVLFVDDRCWVIGQSIKDAASKKPTYMTEMKNAPQMRMAYEPAWTAASLCP